MNKEDIIRMAREAGFNVEKGYLLRITGIDEDLERFAALVASAERERLTDSAMKAAEKAVDVAIALEREACAKVCEDKAERYAERAAKPEHERDINRDTARIAQQTCFHLADNIRARSKE